MDKKKYTVNVHYEAVLTVSGIIAGSEEEALGIASEKASCMSLNDSEVVGENSCVTSVEEASPEDIHRANVSDLENGYYEIVEGDEAVRVNGTTVEVDVILHECEDNRHTLSMDLDVRGKETKSRTTDGPRGRTLYCERGFHCTGVSPTSLKVDGIAVKPISGELMEVLKNILSDIDIVEAFEYSEMY